MLPWLLRLLPLALLVHGLAWPSPPVAPMTLTEMPLASATPSVTPTPSATPTTTPTVTPLPPTTTPWIVTATPSPTPWLVTATPSATPTTVPTTTARPDAYEPNNTPATAAAIGLGPLEKLSFWPQGDLDHFALTIKPSQAGLTLTVTTAAAPGLDPALAVLTADGQVLAEHDDHSPTDLNATVALRVEAGTLLIRVTNASPAHPEHKLYRLETALTAAPDPALTPTPTAPAADGAGPVGDAYSGNYTWAQAAPIPLGETLTALTFGCPAYDYLSPTLQTTCVVPDFFRVTVKGGACYTATTHDLAPGIDTNLIIYGPAGDQAAPWAGNDDQAPGDLASAVAFCVPPEVGVVSAYVLVGPVGNVAPPPPIGERTYALTVAAAGPPATPTPLPAAEAAAPAPPSLSPLPSGAAPEAQAPAAGLAPAPGNPPGMDQIPPPAPTVAPATGIRVEPIPLTEASQPTALPQVVVPLQVVACYDRNQNRACDVDEGISGVLVYVATGGGVVVGHALTDQAGLAQLAIRVEETAELVVSVPAFAATQRTTARSPRLQPVMVAEVAPLPALLP